MGTCMSIYDLIDIHSVAIKRRDDSSRYDFAPATKEDGEDERKKLKDQRVPHFPERPEKDVLLFLIEHAPLKNWQRDVLSIVRDEAYYFHPQGQTKIINEGWASFWHSTIMTQKVLSPSEVVDYADHHSGTMAVQRGRLNPYKLGIELLRDIEHRWNTGRFGKDYDDCDDLDKR